jgi:hypothetical protein
MSQLRSRTRGRLPGHVRCGFSIALHSLIGEDMNNRRDFHQQQDRFGRHRGDDQRSFSRDQHRGGQFGSGQYGGEHGWRGSAPDWDVDSREGSQYGASRDRFGGYSGSMNYGNPYESRPRQSDWSRQNQWDEDRFGYPESNSYGREMSRSQRPGYGPQGRFGEDRYSWGQQYGDDHDMGRGGRQPSGSGDYEPHARHYEPRQSSSWESSWGQGASGGGSGESFAGGRSSYGGQGGSFGGWGIPSGSEPGGYGMNDPYRGSGQQNWSGSNWGNQGGGWGERHSGRFAGSESFGGGMRGRTPKGYTRSDERIKDDVCEQLYRTPDIDVSDVTVEARNGTIALEGTVPDRRMKHRIEDLCEQCIGVQDVENRIRVQREDRSSMRSRASDEERGGAMSSSTSGGTGSISDRSNKKSTGTSSSQH